MLNQVKKIFFQKFSTKKLSQESGMTLIEIMIVLSILGTLIAILAPKITGAGDKARVREAKIQMNEVVKRLELYKNDCNKYPDSLEGLMQKDSCSNWGPEAYVKKEKELVDPWGNKFIYNKKGADFEIRSLGRDGQESGEGYDADISSDDL